MEFKKNVSRSPIPSYKASIFPSAPPASFFSEQTKANKEINSPLIDRLVGERLVMQIIDRKSSTFPAQQDIVDSFVPSSSSKIPTSLNKYILFPPLQPPFKAEDCPFGVKGNSYNDIIDLIKRDFKFEDALVLLPNQNYIKYFDRKFLKYEFYSDIALSYIIYAWAKLKGFSQAHAMEVIGLRQAKLITHENGLYRAGLTCSSSDLLSLFFKKAMTICTDFARIGESQVNKNNFYFTVVNIPKYDATGWASVGKGFFNGIMQSTGRINSDTEFEILGVTGKVRVNDAFDYDTYTVKFTVTW